MGEHMSLSQLLMNRRDFAVAGAALMGLAGVGTRAFAEDHPMRLLFAGSSSTYFNDLPGEVAKVVSGQVSGHPGAPVSAEIVGRSGSDIRVYQDPGFRDYQYGVKPGQTFLNKVHDERFDYVVLQVVCRFIMGDDDPKGSGKSHAEAVTHYCAEARAAGSEPVFYEMGWGSGDRENEGRRRILELAVKNQVRVFAPCSTAWARVRASRPGLDLQEPRDRSHPGHVGHFLNLACFYAAFTREDPTGRLPRTYHVWPHESREEKEARKAERDAAYARFRPDTYQERLPGWMRRNAGAGVTHTLPDGLARELEGHAWAAWNDVARQLS